jgi:uncharacterized membrane protein YedE/YeeE
VKRIGYTLVVMSLLGTEATILDSITGGRTAPCGPTTTEEERGVLIMQIPINHRQPYWNPYLAGLLLGATLLASFLVLGAGLGASGGLARVAAFLRGNCCALPPDSYFGAWGSSPLSYYLVFMLLGVFVGGGFSAILASREELVVERGSRCPRGARLVLAFLGGILAGFASRLASGCTSGQALTGGALLLTGSLVFLIAVFAGGYLFAWFVRREWND